jgi:hypothetical protein
VKLVDTGDLKSPAHCERAGSSPAPGTILPYNLLGDPWAREVRWMGRNLA